MPRPSALAPFFRVIAMLAAGPLCTPPDADLGNPVELHFDPPTIAAYRKGLHAPEVATVRNALAADVAGKADRKTAVLLSGIPRTVLADRFDLLDEIRDPRGDYDLLVVFREDRSSVLQFTVVPPAGHRKNYAIADVRGAKCSLQQQAWLSVRFRELESVPQ